MYKYFMGFIFLWLLLAKNHTFSVCKICDEKLAANKKYNVERHFQKHTTFAEKYLAGEARRGAVSELMKRAEQSKSSFEKWMTSPNSTTATSFVAKKHKWSEIENMNMKNIEHEEVCIWSRDAPIPLFYKPIRVRVFLFVYLPIPSTDTDTS